MRTQLAGDIVWLGGSLLYACAICALAQLAALAPPWARGMPAVARVAHGSVRCRKALREPRVATAICYALLLAVLPGLIAFGVTHAAAAVAAVEAGAFAGSWLGVRLGPGVRVRLIAVAGCVAGFAALGSGIGWFLAQPESRLFEQRAASYLAVVLGALLLGAAASAVCGAAHAGAREGPRAPFSVGDRLVHAAALLLGIALGCGFATAGVAGEFALPALAAGSVLGMALGARLMTRARRQRIGRFALVPAADARRHAIGASMLRLSFAGVPDELLVEACGSGTFAPECLYARAAPPGASARIAREVPQGVPRRQRRRYRALRRVRLGSPEAGNQRVTSA